MTRRRSPSAYLVTQGVPSPQVPSRLQRTLAPPILAASGGLAVRKGGVAVNNEQRRVDLAERVERQRREIGDRPDVSDRFRQLSRSSGRNPIPGRRTLKRSPLMMILLGSAAALVLLACVATAAVAIASGLWLRGAVDSPEQTVQQYYSALAQQDYERAYSYFSDSARQQIAQDAFVERETDGARIGGQVDHYEITKSDIRDATASFQVQVVRRGTPTQAQVESLTLVRAGNAWRIQSLTLGDFVPVSTPNS